MPLRKLVLAAIAVAIAYYGSYQPEHATTLVIGLAGYTALDRFDELIR
ncbi:hypothetical protein [Micromonospora sp. ATA51]|nr:hypothetical protein [Micromonospora sp. ATA51]MBM0226843.1 hypothetical protein [Micromonospora sp. ATA51]